MSLLAPSAQAQVTPEVGAGPWGIFTTAGRRMVCDAIGGTWSQQLIGCVAPPSIPLNDANLRSRIVKGMVNFSAASCNPPSIIEDTGWTMGSIPVPPELHEYFSVFRGTVTATDVTEVRRFRVQTMTTSNGQCVTGPVYYWGATRRTFRLQDGHCGRGNPTLIGTGTKVQALDHSVLAGFPYRWNYASSSAPTAPSFIGASWNHTYSRSIRFTGATSTLPPTVLVSREDGTTGLFQRPASVWTALAPTRGQLQELLSDSGQQTGWAVSFDDTPELSVYDMQGRLTQITSLSGDTVRLAYATTTSLKPLSATQDRSGRALTFQYDAGTGALTSITGAGNRRLILGLDESLVTNVLPQGLLTSVTYPDSSVKRFHYEEPLVPSALTGITDERGTRFSVYTYDRLGRVLSSGRGVGALADRRSFVYNSSNTQETDARGTVRTFGFVTAGSIRRPTGNSQPGGSGCAAATSAVTYDTGGNIASATDFNGIKSCHKVDAGRNLEFVRVEGFASATVCPADLAAYTIAAGATQRKTTAQYHPDWPFIARRAEPGKIVTNVYNGQSDPTNGGAVASCAPSTALLPGGKPIAVLCKEVEQATTDIAGTLGFNASPTGNPRTWSYTYNTSGQRLSATDPRGKQTTYAYYADTTADHAAGDLQSVTNPSHQVSSYTRYDDRGLLLQAADANGVTTTMTYTPRGWVETITVKPAGASTGELTTYEYHAMGSLKKATLPDGTALRYSYDEAQRLTDIQDTAGNIVHYTLDDMGNHKAEDTKDPNGVLARNINRVYDALNRLQSVTGAAQ